MSFSVAPLVLSLAVSATASDYASAFEKSFRESYRASAIRACVAAVTRPVPANIDLPGICACAADRILKTKSVQEMEALPESEGDAAVEACFDEMVGKGHSL